MKRFLFFFISFPFFLGRLSSLEENTVSALKATYEDKNLILNGEVKLFHGLGTLCAEKASLYKEENGKQIPFSEIHLEDNVEIVCKNESILTCDIANLNFQTLKGHILSKGIEPVSYSGIIVQNKEKVPFQIQGEAIDLFFDKKEDDYICNEIKAKTNVVLGYAKDFILKADEAHYKKSSSDTSLNGIVTAYPNSQDSYCRLCYLEETIEASFIEILMDQSRLHLQNPKGSLPSSLFSEKEAGQIFFSCKNLDWDHSAGILTLQEDIQIKETHFGILFGNGSLRIKQNKKTSSLESIHVEGLSVLSHNDYKLTSYGDLYIDGVKGHITLASPKTEGKIKPEEQILFQNDEMQLHSDSAFLEYKEPTHQLSGLTFTGNVRVRSLDNAKAKRCALSDKLIYAPETKTVILSSHPGKKVLFWDEEQGATLSAKEVHLTQNPETNKTEIRGIGNMTLTLTKEEEKLLKNSFPRFSLSEPKENDAK